MPCALHLYRELLQWVRVGNPTFADHGNTVLDYQMIVK
jgi:hypothetical protein